MNYKSTQKGGILSIILIAVVVAAGAGIYLFTNKSQPTTASLPPVTSEPNTQPVENTPTPVTPPAVKVPVVVTPKPKPVVKTAYKNGTYTADGSYQSPAGTETINVTLIIKNDIVIDSTVTGTSDNGRSQRYMSMFISNYKSYVTGKNIDSIQLDKVSGSSLTPNGFNDALSKIKVEAKA